MVAKFSFEVEATFYIYVKNNGFAFGPYFSDFCPKGPIKDSRIYFFVFEEGTFFDFVAEIIEVKEMIFSAIFFTGLGLRVVALTEKASLSCITDSRCLTTVVLPEPEGAEKMMSFSTV